MHATELDAIDDDRNDALERVAAHFVRECETRPPNEVLAHYLCSLFDSIEFKFEIGAINGADKMYSLSDENVRALRALISVYVG